MNPAATELLRTALREAALRALRYTRENGWTWQGSATRTPMNPQDAEAAGFPASPQLWLCRLDGANPLRLVAPDGTAFLPWWQTFPSDGGSIPPFAAKNFPGLADLTPWGHSASYAFHDAAYSAARIWIVPPGGNPAPCPVERADADDILATGLCATGPGGGSRFAEAETIVAAVRAFGAKAWREWRARPAEFFSAPCYAPLFPA